MYTRYENCMNRFHYYRKLENAAYSSPRVPMIKCMQYSFLADYFRWLAARELLRIANSSHSLLRNSRKSSAMKQINFYAKRMQESFGLLKVAEKLGLDEIF